MGNRSADVSVLISGGGPTGLAAALELAYHGVASTVVEPRVTVDHSRPRAKTVSPRTMEHLRRWGLADELRRRAPLHDGWKRRVVFSSTIVDDAILTFDGVFGLDAAPQHAAEAGLQIPQFLVEELLREAVDVHPLIDLQLGVRTLRVDASRNPTGTLAVTVEDDRGEKVYKPERLLVAEGARSASRESLGVQLVGSTWEAPFLNVVFRASGLHERITQAMQYWIVGESGPAVLGPLDTESAWWVGFAGMAASTPHDVVRERISTVLGHTAAVEILAVDPWQARMLTAEQFQVGRVLLLGESAHVNPPFGGHGFNTCIGDAVNAAWKIAAVHNGWGGPALIESYGAERRGVALDTIASAAANLEANVALHDSTREQLRVSKLEEFFSLGLTLGYSYAGSPIVAPGPSASREVTNFRSVTDPGARLPHLTLPDGRALYDTLGPEFTALVPGAQTDAAECTLVPAARRHGIPLTVLPLPDEYPHTDEVLLIRPDQHIADRAADAASIDVERAAGWLNTTDSEREGRRDDD